MNVKYVQLKYLRFIHIKTFKFRNGFPVAITSSLFSMNAYMANFSGMTFQMADPSAEVMFRHRVVH